MQTEASQQPTESSSGDVVDDEKESIEASPQKSRFSIGDYIAIASLFVGLIGAIITASVTISHFKQARTTSYIERVNNPEFAMVRAEIDRWLDSGTSDKEKLQALRADKELQSSLRMFMNILTELGIAYKYNIVDREMTNEIWNPLIPNYWEKLQFYVYGYRINGENTGYYFEYLAKEITKYNSENAEEIKSRYPLPKTYEVNGKVKKTSDLK